MPGPPRTRIGVLAPMKGEFRPLVRPFALEPLDDVYHRGRLGDSAVEVIATQTGIGTQAATVVTERLLDDHAVDHVLIVGIAGGLGPDLDVGDLVVPEVVVDRPNGTRHRATPIGGVTLAGSIVTSDEFNHPREVLDAFIAEGVLAVDMETGSIAGVCERRGVPWTAFRSLSDHDQKAPVDTAVLGLASPDGGANVSASIRYLAKHPLQIPKLTRLARDSFGAMRAAADAAVAAAGRHDWSR
jgi:adenosylhomocysteine nucleosidase